MSRRCEENAGIRPDSLRSCDSSAKSSQIGYPTTEKDSSCSLPVFRCGAIFPLADTVLQLLGVVPDAFLCEVIGDSVLSITYAVRLGGESPRFEGLIAAITCMLGSCRIPPQKACFVVPPPDVRIPNPDLLA